MNQNAALGLGLLAVLVAVASLWWHGCDQLAREKDNRHKLHMECVKRDVPLKECM